MERIKKSMKMKKRKRVRHRCFSRSQGGRFTRIMIPSNSFSKVICFSFYRFRGLYILQMIQLHSGIDVHN